MKKIFNAPEVKLITITHDVIATSGPGFSDTEVSAAQALVGARFADEYDEEEEW